MEATTKESETETYKFIYDSQEIPWRSVAAARDQEQERRTWLVEVTSLVFLLIVVCLIHHFVKRRGTSRADFATMLPDTELKDVSPPHSRDQEA